jgi:hypothetical protein
LDRFLRPLRVLGVATRGTIQNVFCLQFAYVCDGLTFICDPFALVGQSFALVCDPFALVCQGFAAISDAGSQR